MIINGETLGAGNSTAIMQASFNAKPSNIKQIVSKFVIVLFLSLSVDIALIYALFAYCQHLIVHFVHIVCISKV